MSKLWLFLVVRKLGLFNLTSSTGPQGSRLVQLVPKDPDKFNWSPMIQTSSTGSQGYRLVGRLQITRIKKARDIREQNCDKS